MTRKGEGGISKPERRDNNMESKGTVKRGAIRIISKYDDIETLQRENEFLRSQLKNATTWIAALVELHGGEVKIPKQLLGSLREDEFKVERYDDPLDYYTVLKVTKRTDRISVKRG